MAAAIAELNGKPMMAYQGEMPWHRLGTKCASLKSVPAALKAAHIDWTVRLDKLYRMGEKNGTGGRKPVEVNARAVVRDVDNAELGIVSPDYELIQNHEAFEILEPVCKEHGVTIETAGMLETGARVWMLAKLPKSFHPVQGDRVDGYFLVVTGHAGWSALKALPTPVRVVCANTLTLALNSGRSVVTLRHTKTQAAQLDEAARLVTKLVGTLKETNESFTQLAARKLDAKELRAYVNVVLGIDDNEQRPVPINKRDTIIRLAATGKGVELAPSTAWTAFNAVTEYVDHVRPAEGKAAATIASRNQSALFGSDARLKIRALDVARRLAA